MIDCWKALAGAGSFILQHIHETCFQETGYLTDKDQPQGAICVTKGKVIVKEGHNKKTLANIWKHHGLLLSWIRTGCKTYAKHLQSIETVNFRPAFCTVRWARNNYKTVCWTSEETVGLNKQQTPWTLFAVNKSQNHCIESMSFVWSFHFTQVHKKKKKKNFRETDRKTTWPRWFAERLKDKNVLPAPTLGHSQFPPCSLIWSSIWKHVG